jgi:hypothetical protein
MWGPGVVMLLQALPPRHSGSLSLPCPPTEARSIAGLLQFPHSVPLASLWLQTNMAGSCPIFQILSTYLLFGRETGKLGGLLGEAVSPAWWASQPSLSHSSVLVCGQE